MMADEPTMPAPSQPVSVAAKSPEPEQAFDAKAAFEELKKGQDDITARISKIESTLDGYTKDEENEGDAKMSADVQEKEKKETDGLKEELAKHGKDMAEVRSEVSGLKKSFEGLGEALAKHGFSKLQPSSSIVVPTGDDEIIAAAKMDVARRLNMR
jgi:chromosome segregation ATPase